MKHPPQGLPVSTRRQSVQSFTEGTQNLLGGIETKGLSKIWGGGKQGVLYGRCANGEIQNKNNQIHVNKVYHVRQTNDSFSWIPQLDVPLKQKVILSLNNIGSPKRTYFYFHYLGKPFRRGGGGGFT